MFTMVHGQPSLSCYVDIAYDDESYEASGVNLMKDGNVAWGVSQEDLLFDYMTRDLDNVEFKGSI